MATRQRKKRTSLGQLYRRASLVQKAVTLLFVLVTLHGVWVAFVAPVQVADPDVRCPPAVVAAVAGSGGAGPRDEAPVEEIEHADALCTSTGRRWLGAAAVQILIGAGAAVGTLKLAQLGRRRKRRRKRQLRSERATASQAEAGQQRSGGEDAS